MPSKLDYLKKYMGGAPAAAAGVSGGGAKPEKPKKGKRLADGSRQGHNSLLIRDLSEAMPAPREDKRQRVREQLVEQGVEIVQHERVVQAQTIDVESSGVKWKISNHRPVALRRGAAVKKEEMKLEKTHVKEERGLDEVKWEEDSDGDLSPARIPLSKQTGRGNAGGGLGPTPGTRKRHDSDEDISPPRGRATAPSHQPPSQRRKVSEKNLSPPRAQASQAQHDSDADLSPCKAVASRAGACNDSDDDGSPPASRATVQRTVKPESDDDISPPRDVAVQGARQTKTGNHGRHDSDSDVSPPRRVTGRERTVKPEPDDDLSPPRDVAVQGARKNKTGNRGRHDSDSDVSVTGRDRLSVAHGRHDSEGDISPKRQTSPARMSSGLRAGLVAGTDLKKETAGIRQKQREAIESAPAEQTGKGAETVYRNRDGGRVTREEWLESKQKHKKKRASEYPEQELEWGGGVKQTASREEEQAELERIAKQPFARYEPDEKYQEELRNKSDWHDPMKQQAGEDGADQAQAAGGPKQERPRCPHLPWPNRFNILPGYRWDGKVRTNGFEKKIIEAGNMREYEKREAWKRMDADDKD